MIDQILAKNPIIDEVDTKGNTPFMLATLKCSLPICQKLFQLGSDINHQNKDGNTALHLALKAGADRKAVIRFLVSILDLCYSWTRTPKS